MSNVLLGEAHAVLSGGCGRLSPPPAYQDVMAFSSRESPLMRLVVCFAVHHSSMSSQSWGSRASYLEHPNLAPHPIKHTHPVDGNILLRQQLDGLLRHHSTRYGADVV